MACRALTAWAIFALWVLGAMTVVAPAQSAVPQGSSEQDAADLLQVLASEATVYEKAMACRHLAYVGDERAVPALAALLADERLATYARSALEGIPHASAGTALRDAMGTVDGKLLIGVLGSIGKRRDTEAVGSLAKLLRSRDEAVAVAAARALGHIATPSAAEILQKELTQGASKIPSPVATACLICADRLEHGGHADLAIALYEAVRQAGVQQPLRLAATHRLIVSRGRDGLSLLNELLGSTDEDRFRFALQAARDLGPLASGTLLAQLPAGPPPRQVLLIRALRDIGDARALPAILELAKRGAHEVRVEALGAVAIFDDPSVVSTLLEASASPDRAIAAAARSSVAGLRNRKIDSMIVDMLQSDDLAKLEAAVVLAGQRNLAEATSTLFDLADHPVEAIRSAAIHALGLTMDAENLPRLIALALDGAAVDERETARAALKTACARLPREACIQHLVSAYQDASVEDQVLLLEQIAAIGGPDALAVIADAARSEDERLTDTATRLLGDWLTADAEPVLLDLAQSLSEAKYRIRTLRGYLRIARQLNLSSEERVEVCRNALALAERDEEKRLAMQTLGRIRSPQALAFAVSLLAQEELRELAGSAIVSMADGVASVSPAEAERALALVIEVATDPAIQRQASTKLEQIREQSKSSATD